MKILLILCLAGAGVVCNFRDNGEIVPYSVDLNNDAEYGPTTPDLHQFLPEIQTFTEDLPQRADSGYSEENGCAWESGAWIIPEQEYLEQQAKLKADWEI
ncbi:MAG: hypothetical protein Q8P76_00895 [bacterium]|nr:hypothetical protein [bacterium]